GQQTDRGRVRAAAVWSRPAKRPRRRRTLVEFGSKRDSSPVTSGRGRPEPPPTRPGRHARLADRAMAARLNGDQGFGDGTRLATSAGAAGEAACELVERRG